MKLITFNAGLLSITILGGLKKVEPAGWVEERLAKMIEVLALQNADVLLLQEVYSQYHKAQLAGALCKQLPYAAYSRKDPKFRLLPDSLMIFSRYPIASSQFTRFNSGRWDERLLDTKGFFTADIPDSPLGPLRISNVHTTAGVFTHPEHPKIDAVRKMQLEQLVSHTRRAAENSKLILAGDFNCGPGVPADSNLKIEPLMLDRHKIAGPERVSVSNYRRMSELGFADTYASLGLPEHPTWSPTANPLNSGGEHASWGCPAQRIDHVWVEPHSLKAERGSIFLTEHIVPVGNGGTLPISDHYGYWVDIAAVDRSEI